MCTVTFIPCGNRTFITHNRDEKSIRSKAIPPRQYTVNGHRLLFPKDGQAGGTWISVHENGNAAVLLNGAFVKHLQQPPYRKSRGLAFLDIVAAEDLKHTFQQAALNDIEPFTVIIFNNFALYQCRWDGQNKHLAELDPGKCYTWSSVTLYDTNIIKKREAWFQQWQQEHTNPCMEDIIQYHLSAGEGDTHNDLRMNRNGHLLTVSVTSIELNQHKCGMKYMDLQENNDYFVEMNFTKDGVIKQ